MFSSKHSKIKQILSKCVFPQGSLIICMWSVCVCVFTDLGVGLWKESWPSSVALGEQWWGRLSGQRGADQGELWRGEEMWGKDSWEMCGGKRDLISPASSFILTCIWCLGGDSLCAVEGTRCGQSRTPKRAYEAAMRKRWGDWWASYGRPEPTGGWGGWTYQTDFWRKRKSGII